MRNLTCNLDNFYSKVELCALEPGQGGFKCFVDDEQESERSLVGVRRPQRNALKPVREECPPNPVAFSVPMEYLRLVNTRVSLSSVETSSMSEVLCLFMLLVAAFCVQVDRSQ